MSDQTTIEELKAEIEIMKAAVTRSADILEIINLQSRYLHWLETNNSHRIWSELWSHDDSRLRLEVCDGGAYIGPESVRKYYEALDSIKFGFSGQQRGILANMFIASPCVEVSKDGRTAKGMWHLFGPHAFYCTPSPGDEYKLTAYWHFGKYNNDFVKENGKWKFLTLHAIMIFRTPYDKGWLKEQNCRRTPPPPGAPPDVPPSLLSLYSPDSTDNNLYMPSPPEEVF